MRTERSEKPVGCMSKTKRPKLEDDKSLIRWFNILSYFSTHLWALQNIPTHYMLNYRMRCTLGMSYSVEYFVRKCGFYFYCI